MPRIQRLLPLLRPLTAPRAPACQPFIRFSTAPRLRADHTPSEPPKAPSNPREASRAADLAATEAATDADSAQSPAPKPVLPSERSQASAPSQPLEADKVQVPPGSEAREASTTSNLQTHSSGFKTIPKGKKPTRADAVTPSPSPQATSASSTTTTTTTTPSLQSKSSGSSFKPLKKPNKQAAPASTHPTTAAQIQLPPPRYHVARSANKNLPIYTDYKRGGNLHLTTIRKITGDLSALRDELRVFLNKKNEEVKINSLTRHVVVKGHHVPEITEFLRARGM